MKTFLICYVILSLIVIILSFIDITYYDIKWTIKHYEEIDKKVDYYTNLLNDKTFESKTIEELESILDSYDFWMNLQNTKKKIKWLLHI